MSANATAIVDLRTEPDWDPRRLATAAFHWPMRGLSCRLDDIGVRIAPQMLVEHGSQVITPEGLDHVHGGVRRRTTKYQGAGHLIGGRAQNLQIGDVLLPARTDRPALIVNAELSGATVSGAFAAYRFTSREDAYWVWGVLSSSSGRAFRRVFFGDSLSARRNRIGDAPLPWPNDATRASTAGMLMEVESETRGREEEAVATWWTTADLRQIDWQTALATPEPERLLDGIPLAELTVDVTMGKTFDRSAVFASPVEGALSLVTGATLAGRPIRRWLLETSNSVVAEVGDLLVAVVGERANARLLEERSIIDSGVYRVRLTDPRATASIIAYLNGQEGYGLRKILLSGSVIPRLSRNDFMRLRVPESVVRGEGPAGLLEPLAERLERILWPN